MEHLLVFILSLTEAQAQPKEQWLCTETTTQRNGNVWDVCGVGEGTSEGSARNWALESAINEFKQLCQLSHDCNGRDKNAEPLRATCSISYGWWKCYRLVRITVTD